MNKSRDLLKRFASSKSKYFDLPDGEETQVKFLYAEEVPNHFDGGETVCIRYHFDVDGKEMLWDRTSRELAKQIASISEGETILIKRTGEKSKTKYFIRKVE
ncbi:MAG: hypothetical protein PHC54_02490 [Candidatus Omnitrophica bacterium]|nr:hypothetical protein [Candidatus Omnitrophota bacterium]MDD5592258.1 hypothetical protein [Candidatus Omnitrophota bacterium]